MTSRESGASQKWKTPTKNRKDKISKARLTPTKSPKKNRLTPTRSPRKNHPGYNSVVNITPRKIIFPSSHPD